MNTHYRLRDVLEPNGVIIRLEKFEIIKETECGYWVIGRYEPSWLSHEELIKRKFAKWVSKTSRKRYCYPDITQAISSFKRRKEIQVNKIAVQLEQAEKALKEFDKYKDLSADAFSGGLCVGKIPSMGDLVWDY